MKKLVFFIIIMVFVSLSFSQNVRTLDWMLELQKKLELSQKQINQLNDMKFELKKYFINKEAELGIAELEFEKQMRNKKYQPDLVRAKLDQLQNLRGDKIFAEIDNEKKALEMLNDEQRKQLGMAMETDAARRREREMIEKREIEIRRGEPESGEMREQMREMKYEIERLRGVEKELRAALERKK
ncbi:hypothetical protein ACFL4T_11895 [candidate division KSB1 bacterium]